MNHLEPKVPLDDLDPGRVDPGYWDRFQTRVMEAVGPVLAERRRRSVTMGSVMISWSRLVLPLVAAAAVFAVVMTRGAPPETPGAAVAGIEDIIGVPDDGEEPLPSFLHSDEVVDRDLVLLAVEGL